MAFLPIQPGQVGRAMSDEQMRLLCREALANGWRHFKLKVGWNLEDNLRRARIMREEIGPESTLMFDANQIWDVDEAITAMQLLAAFDPFWIEEPTSPDDILGHATIARAIAPIRVATGEHVQNRIIFKQLFQANAIGICQIDACRVGGVNEVLAILLMAAQIRYSGLSTRGRCWPMRICAASLDLSTTSRLVARWRIA